MVDPGHVFRRAFSWLPSQFASQSDAPVGPRQFGSTEHLSTEAVAAFVDGELRMTAASARGPSPVAVPAVRRRGRGPASGAQRIAGFVPDSHTQLAAGPVVADSAPHCRRAARVRRDEPQLADGAQRAPP